MPPRWARARAGKRPKDWDVVEPVLEALENELRDKVKESNEGKRKTESVWPVHQISWQKSRYIYDMYYTYKRIDKATYEYCIKQKLVDGALMAKWKKPGYERLCSTYVINPTNYKFGTTSLCRVPLKDRGEDQKTAQDPTTGCRGCASGKGAGYRNIFGNKYGQSLAAVQIAREQRRAEMEQKAAAAAAANNDDDSETDDDDDEDDYGPSAAVWAGSKRLQAVAFADDDGEAETDEDDDDDEGPMPAPAAKKQKVDE